MRQIITVFAGILMFLLSNEKANACTPSPNFTSSATSINQGQSVDFTSTGGAGTPAATSWTWTFPGGTPGTSTAQHPVGIVYNTPGIYDVTHTATNTYTPPTGTMTKTGYITVWSTTAPGSAGTAINLTGTAPAATAILDINVTDKGVLIPRLTTAERNDIPTPAQGLILYNSSNDSINFYNGTNWQRIDGKQVSTTTGSGTPSGTGIAINTTGNPADPSAILDVSSTTKGLLLPQTMKTSISSPVQGLIIYDTYYKKVSYYDGTAWQTVCSALSTTTTGGGSLPVQGVTLNPTGTLNASAILDLNVSDKGFLLPRLTDAQRNNIIAPAEGLVIYNASTNRINYYNGSAWYSSTSTTPSQPGAISGNAGVCSASSQTYSIADVTDATSYTWTVPSGWTINSGQGTTSINVDASGTSGNITVVATNSCGTSAARILAVSVACCTCPCTFSFNGTWNGIGYGGMTIQSFVVPAGITQVTIECWGGQGGGDYYGNSGGFGGYAKADIPVTPGEILYISVGGRGYFSGATNSTYSGWNGGGNGGGGPCTGCTGGGGGGSSDVRRSGQTLNDRIIVAGGGGGTGITNTGWGGGGGGGGGGWYGGNGGVGENGSPPPTGTGGTQVSGYAFGNGGNGGNAVSFSSAGGYGTGGAGGDTNGGNGGGSGGGRPNGGGGGSGYVDAPGNTNKSMLSGVRSGNGQVVISNCQ